AHRCSDWDPDNAQPGMFDRFWEALGVMSERNGFNACDDRLQALCSELDPIMKEIACTPATSLAGLRVKVLAAIEANPQLWAKPFGDLDYEVKAVRSLIEAACTITDASVPVMDYDGEDFLPAPSAALN